VVHVNRNADIKNAMQRIGGSYSTPASARSVMFVGPHPDDLGRPHREQRRVVATPAGNLPGDDVPSLAFRLVKPDGEKFPRVEWEGM
jgi:hypothetical protein